MSKPCLSGEAGLPAGEAGMCFGAASDKASFSKIHKEAQGSRCAR
jgi:hypothetical protein